MSKRAISDATGRKVRMVEIASAAGVSRSTVSNVMRGLPTVAEDVRERVLDQAARLGYVYDRGAASLRMGQSNLVGLVIPDIANPFIAKTVRGAHEVLSEQGYLVATVETGDDVLRQSLALRSLAEHRADGFLLLPSIGSQSHPLVASLGGLPTVILNRDIGETGLDYVGPDEDAVARAGVGHLIRDHGCASVAYFGGPAGAGPRIARSRAFASIAHREDVRVIDEWGVPCEATASAAYTLARALIAAEELPGGIQCHSDTVAYGLLRALREAGVTPDRCRVIGCDDLDDSEFWNPGVTSIQVAPDTIGRHAARRLLLRMKGDDPVLDATGPVEPSLVIRESCGCLKRR
jgi:LacI family transcriptional regulator